MIHFCFPFFMSELHIYLITGLRGPSNVKTALERSHQCTEKERERERETDRQTDRQTNRQIN